MKKIPDFLCGIQRIKKITRWRLSDKQAGLPGEVSIEAEACQTPIFSEAGRAVGVCRSCAKGWETPDNRFANDAERKRALAAAHAYPELQDEKTTS